MTSHMVVSAVLAALMPLSWGVVTKGSAQDRNHAQLKTQQQSQDKDKLVDQGSATERVKGQGSTTRT